MDEFNTENNVNEQNNNPNDISKNSGYTFDPVTGYYNYDEPKKVEYMKSEQIENITSKKNTGVNWVTVVICVVLSLIIGISGGAFAAGYVLRDATGGNGADVNGPEKNPTNVTITVDETVNSNIVAVAKKVTPSVVGIRTTAAVQSFFGGSTESKGEGSGVIYSTDGYIITNYHVIESATGRTNASTKPKGPCSPCGKNKTTFSRKDHLVLYWI